ncbi:MAG: hypothetical protein ACOZAA_17620 [Pseudomonadota bacterium]
MTHPLIDGLGVSPDIFLHNFDVAGERALLIRLPAEQRRKASFLDDRIFAPGVEGGWAAWSEVGPAAMRAPASKARFIFHIGHCGSTLLSRLIEEASGVRSLREPACLRTLAAIDADIKDGLALWSETEFGKRLALYLNIASAGAQTIIKATSWCGDLASRTSGAAAFCYSKPDAYIATMLGGANNPIDLRLNAPIRLRRLRRLCGARVTELATLSPGELAAIIWATETATIAAVAARDLSRIHAIDFDRFLSSPEEPLAKALGHFSLPATPERIRAALTGPTMRTYSKDSSFDYSPQDRRTLLAEYAAAHGDEITRGRKWLETAGKAHKPIAGALERFGG